MDKPLESDAGGEAQEPLYRPSPRPRPRSVRRFCAAVGLVLGAVVVYIIFKALRVMTKAAIDPHMAMYEPTFMDGTSSAGVRPLIDSDTKFDVVLSVFAKSPTPPVNETEPGSEEWDTYMQLHSHWWFQRHPMAPPEDYRAINMADWIDWVGPLHVPPTEELYSAVVARNLTLQDKLTDVDVDLEIPKSAL